MPINSRIGGINKMNDKDFIESVFEIAFGDNAINREFSKDDVIKELKRFSDLALKYED